MRPRRSRHTVFWSMASQSNTSLNLYVAVNQGGNYTISYGANAGSNALIDSLSLVRIM